MSSSCESPAEQRDADRPDNREHVTRRSSFSPQTRASLERFGFDDPYDPHFIWTSVFGTKMRGHRQKWPHIDFAELSAINSDVVAWVHMDGTPINYPVVAGRLSPTYYLTHNFSGEESCHGQVQLGFWCGRRIGGRNTYLLAHTMNDWSMFRAVRNLCNQAYLDEHPAIELLTPDAHYVARWFAAAQFHSIDPWPTTTRFADDAAFSAWLERIARGNWLRTDVPAPDVHSRILTCATCAQSPGPTDRRALFAVLEVAEG